MKQMLKLSLGRTDRNLKIFKPNHPAILNELVTKSDRIHFRDSFAAQLL